MDTEFTAHPDTDLSWQDEAVCKGLTEVFFGPAAERPERRVEREALAKSYCLSCPVMLPCRRTARLNREHGFWGAENDEERAAAGYAPRSPSRRSVIQARDEARRKGVLVEFGPITAEDDDDSFEITELDMDLVAS
jgi:WhiB family redox-sensing transcriptional regulator